MNSDRVLAFQVGYQEFGRLIPLWLLGLLNDLGPVGLFASKLHYEEGVGLYIK